MRSVLCTVLAFVICAVAFAKEFEGTLTKIDDKSVTVKVGDDEKTYKTTKETVFGGGKKAATVESLTKILEKAKKGIPVKVETDDKDVVTKVTIAFKKKTN